MDNLIYRTYLTIKEILFLHMFSIYVKLVSFDS